MGNKNPVPGRGRHFSSLHIVHNRCWSHQFTYPIGKWGLLNLSSSCGQLINRSYSSIIFAIILGLGPRKRWVVSLTLCRFTAEDESPRYPRAAPDPMQNGKIALSFRESNPGLAARNLQSISGDETVSVNKAIPASPQLTARSGQSAQFSVLTASGCTLTCIQTLDTPAKVHASRDRCMISF
jgi:hypothetical protein